jgi:hypothetical protein
MKTFLSFLSIITLSTLATAQIPTCASACIANAVISAAPSCGVSNLVCQCQPNTLPVIVEAATPCVLDNCTNPIGSSSPPPSPSPLPFSINPYERTRTNPSQPFYKQPMQHVPPFSHPPHRQHQPQPQHLPFQPQRQVPQALLLLLLLHSQLISLRQLVQRIHRQQLIRVVIPVAQ